MHTYTGPNALVYVKVFSKPEKLYPFSLLFDVFLRASFLSPAFFFLMAEGKSWSLWVKECVGCGPSITS